MRGGPPLFFLCLYAKPEVPTNTGGSDATLPSAEIKSRNVEHAILIEGKLIITYFECKDKKLCTIVHFFILLMKFHIHKAKFLNSNPSFKSFLAETECYFESLKFVKKKK